MNRYSINKTNRVGVVDLCDWRRLCEIKLSHVFTGYQILGRLGFLTVFYYLKVYWNRTVAFVRNLMLKTPKYYGKNVEKKTTSRK